MLPQVPQDRALERGPQGGADSSPLESPVRPVVAGKEQVVVVPGEVEELVPPPFPQNLLLHGKLLRIPVSAQKKALFDVAFDGAELLAGEDELSLQSVFFERAAEEAYEHRPVGRPEEGLQRRVQGQVGPGRGAHEELPVPPAEEGVEVRGALEAPFGKGYKLEPIGVLRPDRETDRGMRVVGDDVGCCSLLRGIIGEVDRDGGQKDSQGGVEKHHSPCSQGNERKDLEDSPKDLKLFRPGVSYPLHAHPISCSKCTAIGRRWKGGV